ncbi:MAG: hypothetical protein ACRDV9_00575, partial [Acidimicrobiia bacterium]
RYYTAMARSGAPVPVVEAWMVSGAAPGPVLAFPGEVADRDSVLLKHWWERMSDPEAIRGWDVDSAGWD